MKIIINSDMIDKFFGTSKPTVDMVLNNKIIKHMIKDCSVVGVYKDDMNATDLNNLVIKVIPAIKGLKKNGK